MIISWNSTQACNLNCIHCYRDAGKKFDGELSTAEGKKLLEQIARAGFKIMVFSGGEPLLRSDVYELITYAASLGLRPVCGTNGTLITEEVARRLKEAGLMRAGISIDSLDPSKHDFFRGSEGALRQTLEGINACKSVGLPFQIHTTVTIYNQHEILDIIDAAVEWGAAGADIFFLVPTGRGKEIEKTTLHTAEYEALLKQIIDKKSKVPIDVKATCAPQYMRIAKEMGIEMRYSKGCLAGTGYCIISPKGEVLPCPYLPIPCGNVREKAFDLIWADNEVFNELRRAELKGSCGTCGYNTICGGCRARAYYYNDGDYLAEEPWCSLTAEPKEY